MRRFNNGPKHQKQLYVWEPKYFEIATVLSGCLPYFIIKREQAEIIIAFKTLVVKTPHRTKPLSEEEKSEREGLYQRIHVLNSRGRTDIAPSIYKAS